MESRKCRSNMSPPLASNAISAGTSVTPRVSGTRSSLRLFAGWHPLGTPSLASGSLPLPWHQAHVRVDFDSLLMALNDLYRPRPLIALCIAAILFVAFSRSSPNKGLGDDLQSAESVNSVKWSSPGASKLISPFVRWSDLHDIPRTTILRHITGKSL